MLKKDESVNKKYFSILKTAPGPSPWFFENKILFNEYQWRDLNYKRALYNKENQVVLLANFYCYYKELPDGLLLGWIDRKNAIHFFLFDIKKLTPLKNPEKHLPESFIGFHFDNGLISKFVFPTKNISLNKKFVAPLEFKKIGELLILADQLIENKVQKTILYFNFNDKTTKSFPQDWFNKGDYDFGYQWITKVAFVPGTKEIVGEGIRLGYFILDKSYRQIERWLTPTH